MGCPNLPSVRLVVSQDRGVKPDSAWQLYRVTGANSEDGNNQGVKGLSLSSFDPGQLVDVQKRYNGIFGLGGGDFLVATLK